MIEKLIQRNVSEIKCPRHMEEAGIIAEMIDVRLSN